MYLDDWSGKVDNRRRDSGLPEPHRRHARYPSGMMQELVRRSLVLGGVAIHFWTAWVAWTAKGLFAGLFTLTVPVLGEVVWAGWLTYEARTPWIPYVQVLVGYIVLLIAYLFWERRSPPASRSG